MPITVEEYLATESQWALEHYSKHHGITIQQFAERMVKFKNIIEEENKVLEKPGVRELVEKLKDYATEHYNEGWDVIVECSENREIGRVIDINNFTELRQLVEYYRPMVEYNEEQRVYHKSEVEAMGGRCY